jgi:hypothetical protein
VRDSGLLAVGGAVVQKTKQRFTHNCIDSFYSRMLVQAK